MLSVVPILILLVSFSLADNGSPCHYRLFCVLFWMKIFSSQFLLLFQSFILSSPPSTFCLNISEDDHGSTVYVDLISDINECSENTHKCSKGKATCANTAGSFICSCRPGFTFYGHNCRGKILKGIISFIRKKIHCCCCLLPKGANALKKLQSTGPGCFFIGRFNYAEEGITRSKSNVI